MDVDADPEALGIPGRRPQVVVVDRVRGVRTERRRDATVRASDEKNVSASRARMPEASTSSAIVGMPK
ncbi:MAG: hypothetical protein K0R81_2558 [Microbacterium sp.]|nr:hypothetical protein [Microbacterium sp.]